MDLRKVLKGDHPGHPFRGNQYTEIASDGDAKVMSHDGDREGSAISVQRGGKEVATGDYDSGASGFFVGGKFFNEAQEIAQHYKTPLAPSPIARQAGVQAAMTSQQAMAIQAKMKPETKKQWMARQVGISGNKDDIAAFTKVKQALKDKKKR